MDLVTNIRAPRRAADEPLLRMSRCNGCWPILATSSSRRRTPSGCASWDVRAALSGRTYAAEGSLVLEGV